MEFDVSTPKAIIAFVLVVALIGLVVWLVRRFSGERVSSAGVRGRQPRLAVIDAATVDGRRRLVLIRRDNVEHLMMIGGPTDVVIEASIVRAAPAREAVPQRAPAAAEAPRAAAPAEGTMWPLQPEPAARPEPPVRVEPVVKLEPAPRAEPAARPQRQPPPPPLVEEPVHWSEPEPVSPQTGRERRSRGADPLIGLAQELARAPDPEEPAAIIEPPPRQAPRREPRVPRPQPAPPPAVAMPEPEPPFDSAAADQNLAEMAQRLEAALRRPARSDETRSPRAEPSAAEMESETDPAAPASREQARSARSARVAGAAPPQRSLYDSLEQEMASLLGRPGGKS